MIKSNRPARKGEKLVDYKGKKGIWRTIKGRPTFIVVAGAIGGAVGHDVGAISAIPKVLKIKRAADTKGAGVLNNLRSQANSTIAKNNAAFERKASAIGTNVGDDVLNMSKARNAKNAANAKAAKDATSAAQKQIGEISAKGIKSAKRVAKIHKGIGLAVGAGAGVAAGVALTRRRDRKKRERRAKLRRLQKMK